MLFCKKWFYTCKIVSKPKCSSFCQKSAKNPFLHVAVREPRVHQVVVFVPAELHVRAACGHALHHELVGVVERALLVQVHLLDAEGGPVVDPQVQHRVPAAAHAASPVVAEFRRRVLDGAEIAEDGKMRPYLAQSNTSRI